MPESTIFTVVERAHHDETITTTFRIEAEGDQAMSAKEAVEAIKAAAIAYLYRDPDAHPGHDVINFGDLVDFDMSPELRQNGILRFEVLPAGDAVDYNDTTLTVDDIWPEGKPEGA